MKAVNGPTALASYKTYTAITFKTDRPAEDSFNVN